WMWKSTRAGRRRGGSTSAVSRSRSSRIASLPDAVVGVVVGGRPPKYRPGLHQPFVRVRGVSREEAEGFRGRERDDAARIRRTRGGPRGPPPPRALGPRGDARDPRARRGLRRVRGRGPPARGRPRGASSAARRARPARGPVPAPGPRARGGGARGGGPPLRPDQGPGRAREGRERLPLRAAAPDHRLRLRPPGRAARAARRPLARPARPPPARPPRRPSPPP